MFRTMPEGMCRLNLKSLALIDKYFSPFKMIYLGLPVFGLITRSTLSGIKSSPLTPN